MKFTLSSKLALVASLVLLSGCDTVREQFAQQSGPDEFSVVRRAPLERPPENYNNISQLPVPVLGKARPQELSPVKEAEKVLVGEAVQASATEAPSASVNELLAKAGANQADPTIRNTIESEHLKLQKEELATVDRLIGKLTNKSPSATIVDAKAEYERLKKNNAEGKSVLHGETPTMKYD